MRIISGKWKSRSLDFPKSREFRPTQDRVKESLFSILAPQLSNAIVWDLCSGSGALGIESLSRGAAHVTFVDTNTTYIKKNTQSLLTAAPPLSKDQFQIIKSPVSRFLDSAPPTATLILMDPPWQNTQVYTDILTHPILHQCLAKGAFLLCEYTKKYTPQFPPQLHIQKTYTYGASTLAIITGSC